MSDTQQRIAKYGRTKDQELLLHVNNIIKRHEQEVEVLTALRESMLMPQPQPQPQPPPTKWQRFVGAVQIVAGCLFGLFLLICVILGLHDIVFWVNEYFGWM